ncbi:MAG: saccharopine dehydrogenase NADP-binding domain-containing protein [Pseudomonadales bacterium]
MNQREFDVVVWGATGFTGRLVAEYLLRRYGVGGELRWAIAGRNERKLEELRGSLGAAAASLPLVIGDSDDRVLLDVLAARTRVVCSTVGPYALYGSNLVAACAHQGTHYCDLTGEVQWMREMIDRFHAPAGASGARIVHTCGFDSIPSDMGVWFVQQAMRARHGVPARSVSYRARAFKGGFSGGTIASMLNMLDEAERDPSLRRLIEDPYGLNPEGQRRGLDGPERVLPFFDQDFDAWVTPFVMATINTKVVRRTNALLGYAFGHEFRYDEGTLTPFGVFGFPLAAAISTGSAAFTAAAGFAPLRRVLARMLPKPGEGPTEATRESGYYVIELLARHPTDPTCNLRAEVRGDRDPGYGSTSKMLAESAVCLAKDPLTSAGGVLTPAVAMGDALLARLNEHAGVTFRLLGSSQS